MKVVGAVTEREQNNGKANFYVEACNELEITGNYNRLVDRIKL